MVEARADAEPIPELEFDQMLGLKICGAQMAHSAEGGCGSGAGRVR